MIAFHIRFSASLFLVTSPFWTIPATSTCKKSVFLRSSIPAPPNLFALKTESSFKKIKWR